MRVTPIEVEIDAARNESLRFRPLQRTVRGRFDLNRVAEPQARLQSAAWPVPIPGQRLGIDAAGSGYLLEPLHDTANASIREKIEKAGMRLEPELTEFPDIDSPTWLYWIKRAVESGIARVISGNLPKTFEGKPKKSFLIAESPKTTDRLAEAIEKQTAALEKLFAKLGE